MRYAGSTLATKLGVDKRFGLGYPNTGGEDMELCKECGWESVVESEECGKYCEDCGDHPDASTCGCGWIRLPEGVADNSI